jgi:hypothetical protein
LCRVRASVSRKIISMLGRGWSGGRFRGRVAKVGRFGGDSYWRHREEGEAGANMRFMRV